MTVSEQVTELWIRLIDGRSLCERYNQLEMAEFVRESMIDRLCRGEPVTCYDGETRSVAAAEVKRIDLIVAHETDTRAVV